ncbi:hypothetical protein EXIGLDRAFT_838574 [Exidia glandulosa HHB12029]|uniref:DUF7918 domain-containing protein n=1 Tax=Exidia glandulosa HHB12029 TaxID=1314781 RepID=A0A165FR22_EXIGL|nr:hypothetical protein EXIGLDRAFT_838574 [Exidia glandulosa HHB12029]
MPPPTSIACNGYRAWVKLELEDTVKNSARSDRVPVYQAQTSPSGATGWIASVPGERFSVHWEGPLLTPFCGQLYVDGTHVDGRVVRAGQKPPQASITHVADGKGTARPLVFSQIALTGAYFFTLLFESLNDDRIRRHADDRAALDAIGTIRLEILRIANAPPAPRVPKSSLPTTQARLHEKDKKLGGHHAMLGQATPAHVIAVAPQYLDDGEPFIVFEFKYRAEDILLAQGIVKRSESSKKTRKDPPPAVRPIASGSHIRVPLVPVKGELKREYDELYLSPPVSPTHNKRQRVVKPDPEPGEINEDRKATNTQNDAQLKARIRVLEWQLAQAARRGAHIPAPDLYPDQLEDGDTATSKTVVDLTHEE